MKRSKKVKKNCEGCINGCDHSRMVVGVDTTINGPKNINSHLCTVDDAEVHIVNTDAKAVIKWKR